MAPPARPSLSITLPPNFEFHYSDGGLPRTPDRPLEEQTPLNPPPPPRPQTFKVRRKRAAIPEFYESEPMSGSSDMVIPTIEISEAEMSSPVQPTPTMEGLLAPAMPAFQRLVTPPKTPTARPQFSFSSPIESTANEWDLISSNKLRPAFERSGSVCSSFSDSSISSCGSSAFSAPNLGCASPESEATDPFLEDDMLKEDKVVLSPDLQSSPTAKRAKVHRDIKWTTPMDEHLWMTFLQYLGDPRVTPFKMLAGTPPPLGVCSRVASKARRTWSSRKSSAGLDTLMTTDRMQREGSPDTIRPSTNVKQPQWPRGDGATRKRLRNLCKRRPSLPAHYQRLLNTRSPSPFASSSSAERTPQNAFASYEMKMSLVTATAPSMQPEGPLAQLSSDEPVPAARPQTSSQRTSRPTDWFARIPRSKAHQKSLSLQSSLSLHADAEPGTLASPFDDTSNRMHLLQSMSQTKSLGRAAFKDGPSLDAPVELSGAPTASRTSLKRRFKSDEEKPARPALYDVFGPQADDSVIIRNRGFSVGAVRATDNLAKLFTPPPPPVPAPSVDHIMAEAPNLPDTSDLGPPGSRSAPRRLAEPVPRLGSPFTEVAGRQFNTFPRTYVATASNPQPFQQRLRELAAHNAAHQSR
ncbi:hypothetical protein B0A55_11647 [Friedmanniomyces simplex]|uniref:Uncharacterized protein n=1 Tax=Friedmanniomyces simplex TaxID=329884 RepID=A0A4U0WH17_9PEZI|nr:hypothetical protein B0A55_11647 [Friedmanniomyces simplex]